MFPSFVSVSLVIVREDECSITVNISGWLLQQLPKPPTDTSAGCSGIKSNQRGLDWPECRAHSLTKKKKTQI